MSSRTAELFNQGFDFSPLSSSKSSTTTGSGPLGHTVADALAIPVIDLYVHAWDLAATINLVIEIPGSVIGYAHDHLDQVPEEIIRGENRAFAPKAQAPADATPTEEFLAWTGRQLPSASAVLRQGDLPLGRR
jgi:hypothetical protein